MKELLRVMYFGFIAILMLSEFFMSNLYSLLFALEETAEMMQVDAATERTRLIILLLTGGIAGFGALLASLALRNKISRKLGYQGMYATVIGMIAYGVFQVWSANYQLGAMQDVVIAVGIGYAGLGAAGWFVGSILRSPGMARHA